jgi:hypothetical protein
MKDVIFKCPFSARITVRFEPAGCPFSSGIGVRFAQEQVSAFHKIMQEKQIELYL